MEPPSRHCLLTQATCVNSAKPCDQIATLVCQSGRETLEVAEAALSYSYLHPTVPIASE